MEELKKGVYRHYKGGQYKLIGEAIDSETKQVVVVYQEINKEDKIWVRSKEMFVQEVKTKEGLKPRFIFQKELEEESWENKYLRALADYQNVLKQSAREREEFVKYAVSDFLQDILPVYDHLKLSILGLNAEEAKNPWAVGVGHVLKQFKEVLESRGIMEIKTVGEKFDHNTMEAISGEGETVKQEIMPGYKLNGRVIRPAKVIVEKEKENIN